MGFQMVGLTIMFTFMFTFMFIITVLILFYVQKRKAINSLAVGQRFVYSFRKDDPWANDSEVYTILELKNGWVRFAYGGVPMRTADPAERFIEFKVKISD